MGMGAHGVVHAGKQPIVDAAAAHSRWQRGGRGEHERPCVVVYVIPRHSEFGHIKDRALSKNCDCRTPAPVWLGALAATKVLEVLLIQPDEHSMPLEEVLIPMDRFRAIDVDS